MVNINGKEQQITLSKKERVIRVDISRYIDDGFNTVTFHAPSLGRSFNAYIELVEKYNKIEYHDDESTEK